MRLLKLVIVDDEPILLEGLLKTYDWNAMGFEVVGSARTGEQAIHVIKEKQPHVVLTDIRMKQISGLMVMEEIEKEGIDCLFIVLSAYRDFEYAQQACDLGAFAYLLKPIEDEKLLETMQGAWSACMEQIKNEEKYDSWEKLLVKDADSFLQVIVQKYVQNHIPAEKAKEVFTTLNDVLENDDKFITVYVDIDLTYKITNSLDYEAARFAMIQLLTEKIQEQFFYWKFENEDGNYIFIVKTKENISVRALKQILEMVKKKEKYPVIAAISKPYKGLVGIKRSYEDAKNLFALASISGASAFTISEDIPSGYSGTSHNLLQGNSSLTSVHMASSSGIEEKPCSADTEILIVNAVRRNNARDLKDAFIQFIYSLPPQEEQQCQYMHKMMLKAEFMIKDSYGLTENMKEQFQNYYSNLQNLNATRAMDVCYKILCRAIEQRKQSADQDEIRYFQEYISAAVAYIEEHLDDEELSIVSVATHVYLNPVYFGRVFKNTFHMTFKRYLMQCRMEKAKRLLEEGKTSIGNICEQVGISNPSYFSHLFKSYTGKLPSEYKKEYEV